MGINISKMTMAHFDDVVDLWQQSEGVGLDYTDLRNTVQLYLDRNPGMSLVASSGDKIVGAVLAGHDGIRGYLHHLAIASDYRRKGIARNLVNRCIINIADSGIQKCHILIFHNNIDGINFWESMKWTQRDDIGVISKFI